MARVRRSDTSKIPPVRVGGHLYFLSLGNLTNDLLWLWSYGGTQSVAPLLQKPEHTLSTGMAQMACLGDKINYNMSLNSPRPGHYCSCQSGASGAKGCEWEGGGGSLLILCTHHYLPGWHRSRYNTSGVCIKNLPWIERKEGQSSVEPGAAAPFHPVGNSQVTVGNVGRGTSWRQTSGHGKTKG